jgi:ferredoxin
VSIGSRKLSPKWVDAAEAARYNEASKEGDRLMTVTLDSEKCIGCGLCAQIAPNVFSLDAARGVAKVIREEGDPAVEQAVKSCPVTCIHVEE